MSQIKTIDGGPALRARVARTGACASTEAATLMEARYAFDTNDWMALLAEQRMRIASAAGVDPSKVKIRIGH